MNVKVLVCVLLAALTSGSLGLLPSQSMMPRAGEEAEPVLSERSSEHARSSRSARVPPPETLSNYNQLQETAGETHRGLSQLLATLISSRRGPAPQSRSSISSRASGPGPAHRIKDRDYLGWMDFGRRSAEEYEYSS